MSKQVTLQAPDISCKHCAMTIKRELAPIAGVQSVEVNVPAKTISLTVADDEALARAKAMLVEIGYPPA